jgi:hypothetical protein
LFYGLYLLVFKIFDGLFADGYLRLIVMVFLYILFVLFYIVLSVLCSIWLREITKSCLLMIKNDEMEKEGKKGVLSLLVNEIERIVLILSFGLFIFFIDLFGKIGWTYFILSYFIKFILMSLLNSVYIFELALNEYIKYSSYKDILFTFESNLFYFIGFGLPFTIIINITQSFIYNVIAFTSLFPIFLVSATLIIKKRAFTINKPKLFLLKPIQILDNNLVVLINNLINRFL